MSMFEAAFVQQVADAVAAKVVAELAAQGVTKPKRLMSATEAANYVGRSKQALYHLVSQGKIPVKRQGSRLFFDRVELDTWIAHLSD